MLWTNTDGDPICCRCITYNDTVTDTVYCDQHSTIITYFHPSGKFNWRGYLAWFLWWCGKEDISQSEAVIFLGWLLLRNTSIAGVLPVRHTDECWRKPHLLKVLVKYLSTDCLHHDRRQKWLAWWNNMRIKCQDLIKVIRMIQLMHCYSLLLIYRVTIILHCEDSNIVDVQSLIIEQPERKMMKWWKHFQAGKTNLLWNNFWSLGLHTVQLGP